MATALREIEPSVEETVGALVDQTVANPIAVFTDEQKFSDFYARLKEETDRHVPDLSTAGGRKAIASLAYRVTKAKTSLDKAGLGLTEEWRSQIALVNASRKKMTAELDELAAEVRKPLTDWEEAEKTRIAECEAVIKTIRDAATVTIDDTFASIQARGSSVHQTVIDLDRFGTFAEQALEAKKSTIGILMEAMRRLKKEEADRAELEKLRTAQAEREAQEAAEREARERAEAKRAYARQIMAYITDEVGNGTIGGKPYPYPILIHELEEKIESGEHHFGDLAQDVERVRVMTLAKVREAFDLSIEKARKQAEENAAQATREEEQRKAKIEQDRKDAEARAAIDEANRRAEAAEQAALAERDRLAALDQAARDRAEHEAAEQRRIEANKELQRQLKTEAKLAIMSCGVSEDAAQKLVLAVRAGEIPHITWAAQLPQQEG